ncbi:MAG: hypothetical protein IIA14_15990 [SAR324 cluster bacterium]|nr:hypothetical protein [SAR324 cluster bacterium]
MAQELPLSAAGDAEVPPGEIRFGQEIFVILRGENVLVAVNGCQGDNPVSDFRIKFRFILDVFDAHPRFFQAEAINVVKERVGFGKTEMVRLRAVEQDCKKHRVPSKAGTGFFRIAGGNSALRLADVAQILLAQPGNGEQNQTGQGNPENQQFRKAQHAGPPYKFRHGWFLPIKGLKRSPSSQGEPGNNLWR